MRAILDTGSQITVVNSKYVPFDLQEPSGGVDIKLEGAFGDVITAKMINLPCSLMERDMTENKECITGTEILISCAITDKLSKGTECLLSWPDFNALQRAGDAIIPQVSILNGTQHIQTCP